MSARESTTTPARLRAEIGSAEQSSWEKMIGPERVECVQQHDIEVSPEPPMLKPVIQHQHLRLQLLDRDVSQRRPVSILQMRDIRQVLVEHQALIIQPFGLAITPAQQSDS